MRKAFILPNLFTWGSLCCGCVAILNALNVAEASDLEGNKFILSCWLIVVAAVLDLLDGLVARMTRTESAFGAQFDSLADVISFGVAPAFLMYTRLLTTDTRPFTNEMVPGVVTIFFISCGALRLARFNVQKAATEKKSFTGLPIPAAACMMVSTFLFIQRLDPDWQRTDLQRFTIFLMGTLSALMVSRVSYPSFKQLRLEKRRSFEAFPILLAIIAMVILAKNVLEMVVFGAFAGYIVAGIAGHMVAISKRRTRDPEARPAPELP